VANESQRVEEEAANKSQQKEEVEGTDEL